MGVLHRPHRVKLIAGILSNDIRRTDNAIRALVRAFGAIDYESAATDFTQSDYYDKEMGQGLKKKFVSFKKLIGLDNIFKVKLLANLIERKLSVDDKRRVNIDPGYIDLAKLVLFSTKDYIHRIYLAGGIYAESTLYYKEGRYNPWPWTYPDYKTELYLNIFGSIRELYSRECRK